MGSNVHLTQEVGPLFSKILFSHSNFKEQKEHFEFSEVRTSPSLSISMVFFLNYLFPTGPGGDLPIHQTRHRPPALLSCSAHSLTSLVLHPWLCLASPGCRMACGHCSRWPGWDSAIPSCLLGPRVSSSTTFGRREPSFRKTFFDTI